MVEYKFIVVVLVFCVLCCWFSPKLLIAVIVGGSSTSKLVNKEALMIIMDREVKNTPEKNLTLSIISVLLQQDLLILNMENLQYNYYQLIIRLVSTHNWLVVYSSIVKKFFSIQLCKLIKPHKYI